MKVVAVGSDHVGVPLKEEIVRLLQEERWEIIAVGTHDARPVDDPIRLGNWERPSRMWRKA